MHAAQEKSRGSARAMEGRRETREESGGRRKENGVARSR
jgi:hypothetical protein